MFLIFFVLLLEYNSFWQVFVTLSTVIMSTAGVLLGMLITGMSFSAIMTGLGIVALAGIVVKNGIVLIDTYNHYTRGDGVEPIKAMLLTISQRIRPVLLTATVTALGVIPMALNVEFDFIRREIVVGGLAGAWFVHLSAALVSGLFFSTALTLIMVPVMVTAPSVTWGHARAFGGNLAWFLGVIGGAIAWPLRAVAGLLVRRTGPVMATADSAPLAVPGDGGAQPAQSVAQYVSREPSDLIEEEKNGVTVVSRQAAE
jgi:multidrug efflux pump